LRWTFRPPAKSSDFPSKRGQDAPAASGRMLEGGDVIAGGGGKSGGGKPDGPPAAAPFEAPSPPAATTERMELAA